MSPNDHRRVLDLHFSRTLLVLSAVLLFAFFLPVMSTEARFTSWVRNVLGRDVPAVSSQPGAIGLPRVVFWAWERPEDLRFIDPHTQGVAFLARTIELRSFPPGDSQVKANGVLLRPRLQPLAFPAGTPLMAVVRIESSNDLWHQPGADKSGPASAGPLYTEAQRDRVAALTTEAVRLPGVKALQIDFDASLSERIFYEALLKDLRARMPKGMPLSITALASWCIGDNWLDRLPAGTIDEAVPMLFRMGPDAENVASYLKSGKDFNSRLCRSSLGVSTDESFSQALLNGAIQPHSARWHAKRVYVFSPKSWAKQDADTITREILQ
jgi:hypothetical protein